MEWHKESVETATNNMLAFSNQSVRLADELVTMTKRADQLERERDAYMEECDSGRTKGYNEGYSDGYQDGTKGI